MDSRVTEKYDILKELGRGGYGIVYLAKHKQLEELKAIKELTPKTKTEKKRVKREVEVLQQAYHPHIIRIDEVISSEQSTYICMEYAQGGTLEEKIKKPIQKQKALAITIDVLKGIQALHAKGIVHRDIKPANILFDSTEKGKIGDFGIAKTSLNISKQLTQTGTALGTVGYMPPEQLLGKKNEIDEQVDIYATGVMLYEMLVGEHPFKGKTQLETVNRALQEKYIIPLEKCKIEQELATICYKAINKNKLKRYRHASEMLEDISAHYLNDTNIKKKVNTQFKKTLQSGMIGLLSGALLCGIGIRLFDQEIDIKSKWEKSNHEPQKVNEIKLKIIEKRIQRNIYDQLQKGNKISITEKVIKSENLYKLGTIYYQGRGVKQDYEIAYKYFKNAEHFGSLEAKLELAKMYEFGVGVEKDITKAIEYYTFLINKNDARGFYALGLLYLKEDEQKKSLQLLEQSASMNHIKSIEQLTKTYISLNNSKKIIYYLQKGVKLNNSFCLKEFGISLIFGKYNLRKNESKGIDYIKKSIMYGNINAIQFLLTNQSLAKKKKEKILADILYLAQQKAISNDINSLLTLGYMYLEGVGTKKDQTKAITIYQKILAIEENSTAFYNLAQIYKYGYGVQINYSKAVDLYQRATYLGSVRAMYNLGVMYERGQGVKTNYTKAKELYEKAVFLGSPPAMYNLGIIHYQGKGVKINYTKAKELFEKAVSFEHPQAMYTLALLYYNGYDVKINYTKAKELFEKAVSFGHTDATYNLGVMYEHGKGVKINYSKAKELYEKVTSLGHLEATYSLGNMYYHGQGIKKNDTQAKRLFEQAVSFEHPQAMYKLGIMYYLGEGVNINYSKAKELFEKATSLGHIEATHNLATIYYQGKGVKINYSKAKELFEKAASLGNTEATYNLGIMYHRGEGVNRNYSKAKELFEKVTSLRHPQGTYNLGVMYYLGEGVNRNYPKAKELFEKAASLDNPEAIYTLGIMYYLGEGVKINYSQTKQLFEKATSLGHIEATYNLGVMYYDGKGGQKNDSQAKKLFEKAASLGHVQATYNLGIMYYHGEGVKKNDNQAKKLFKKAYSLGYTDALKVLKVLEQKK